MIKGIADRPHEDVCTRCLIPGTCWLWDDAMRCQPCHRTVLGNAEVDRRIIADHDRFGDLWSDDLLDRAIPHGDGPDG